MNIAGIDEAGRGPIIGPMVLAGVLIAKEDEKKLKDMGVKDSKLLTHEEREELFPKIKQFCKSYEIVLVDPKEIDDAVRGVAGLNLNRLEAKKTAEILNTLKPDIAYVDSPSTNLSAYNDLIKSQLQSKMKLVTEHKADVNYLCAAAASILAKVTRDKEIERIKKEINIDFGSGYLSDPKTAKFLKEHHTTHAALFRKSWAPYAKAISSTFQQSLESFAQKSQSTLQSKLARLIGNGFERIEPKSAHEEMRLKGPCTIILYTNGTLLLQGNDEAKERVQTLIDSL